jgi:hypothetical protein
MQAIKSQIIDEHIFKRIRDYGYGDGFPFKTYKEFMEWQDKCLIEMRSDDYNWICGLCSRVSNGKVSLMDEDTCVTSQAVQIYFDDNRNVVIMNTR